MKSLIQKRLEEICQEFGLADHLIMEFIKQEWINPANTDDLLFDEEDTARIMLICDLRDEFGVNDEAVPIILNLVDQLNLLRTRLEQLKRP